MREGKRVSGPGSGCGFKGTAQAAFGEPARKRRLRRRRSTDRLGSWCLPPKVGGQCEAAMKAACRVHVPCRPHDGGGRMGHATHRGSAAAATMPSVMLRAAQRMSLRLWAGVLLACALVLCVTGVARSAEVLSGNHVKSMPQLVQGAHDVGPEGATASVKAPGSDGFCPAASDQCARPQAVAAPAAPAAPASAAQAPAGLGTVSTPQGWVPRSGVPPSDECAADSPELHRLCVSRT